MLVAPSPGRVSGLGAPPFPGIVILPGAPCDFPVVWTDPPLAAATDRLRTIVSAGYKVPAPGELGNSEPPAPRAAVSERLSSLAP